MWTDISNLSCCLVLAYTVRKWTLWKHLEIPCIPSKYTKKVRKQIIVKCFFFKNTKENKHDENEKNSKQMSRPGILNRYGIQR